MRYLAVSLADGVLVDASLIPPCPPIPHTKIRKVRRGPKTHLLVNEKRCMSQKVRKRGVFIQLPAIRSKSYVKMHLSA